MSKLFQVLLLFPAMLSIAFGRFDHTAYSSQNALIKQPVQAEVGDEDSRVPFRSLFFLQRNFHRNRNNEFEKAEFEDNALFLTPYIESGQIEKGQELATVPPMMENVESFAGYLTVNNITDSNMFFWLFKSQKGNWEEKPLVIWLQGGPGASSLFGLFREVGPFYVTKDQKLVKREYSWNRECNLLFFDNPVGTGFSFTKMKSGYAQTETDVARDLYGAILQLHKLFPSLQKNKLFITGESYAGKYIPAIAYKIHKTKHDLKKFKINLAGLMIGNGRSDPIHQLGYAFYLYELGLIDGKLRDELVWKESEIRAEIESGEFGVAFVKYVEELNNIRQSTGLESFYDFVNDSFVRDGPEEEFIANTKTKGDLHVGSHEFSDGDETYNNLASDRMQSVKPWVETLLTAEEFPILYYSGQLDIVVAYPLSLEFYNSLKWPRAEEYHKAKRCKFEVEGEVAGYYKTAGTFTEVLVRNTGHMVPTGQPKWAFELFHKFINDSSSFKC